MALFFIILIVIIIINDELKTAALVRKNKPESQRNIKRRREAWDELNQAIYGQK